MHLQVPYEFCHCPWLVYIRSSSPKQFRKYSQIQWSIYFLQSLRWWWTLHRSIRWLVPEIHYRRGELEPTRDISQIVSRRDDAANYTVVEEFCAIPIDDVLVGELYVDLATSSAIYVENITETPSNSSKRYNCPLRTMNYELVEVAQQGQWWSQWQQATGKEYCRLDPAGGSILKEITWTIGYSIAFDVGISIEKVIGAMAGIGIGIDRSTSRTCGATCNCMPNLQVCIWEQSLFTWSDTQKQKCTRFANCEGGYTDCGPWSEYQRTNAPYKNADCRSYNYGCSTNEGCNF